MYAPTIDTGPYVGMLQAFGPPEVVPLPDFDGGGSGVEDVQGLWEVVLAVSFQLATDASVADRFARVRAFAGETTPFAEVLAPFQVAATKTSQLTFAVGAFPAGVASGASLVQSLPPLVLLPGWSLIVDVLGGVAGDVASSVRVYRQRYRVIEVE